MTINKVVAGVGAVAGFLAAVLWLWASLVPVPDNMDTFIGALQWSSRLNASGAGAQAVAAVCAAFLFTRHVKI